MSSTCKVDKCRMPPKDEEGFCTKHKPKPSDSFKPDEDAEEVKEVGEYRVTFCYSVEETLKVVAPDEDEAKAIAEDERDYDGEIVAEPMTRVDKVGTTTKEKETSEKQIEQNKEYWEELDAL